MKDGVLDGELRRMSVSPQHRRLGIARILLHTLINHARANKVRSISLGTTEYQLPAHRLYEKFGWVEEHRKCIRDGLFRMWLIWYKLDL